MAENGRLAWYDQALNMAQIQQCQIFLLYGEVNTYPRIPGESLAEYLWVNHKGEIFDGERDENPRCIEISPIGVKFRGRTQEYFDSVSPPPEGYGLPPIVEAFQRLDAYFKVPDSRSILILVHDADLLFDSDSPLIEPEKTLLAYIRLWASKNINSIDGRLTKIFLLSSSPTWRPALTQGRVTPIKIGLPTQAEREGFLSKLLDRLANPKEGERQIDIKFEAGLDLSTVARITGALNLIQLEDVVFQACLEKFVLKSKQVQSRKDQLIKAAYGGIIEILYPTRGFAGIVGYESLKKYMTDYVQPKLRAGDSRCPKGCLLTGPPGTGKTLFAKALAAELGLPLVIVQTEKIKNKYVGESNKNMARLCEGITALSPCIVLIDEIDKMFSSGDDSSGVSQEITGQFQSFLNDIERGNAFFVGTTNYPSRVPRAMLRPGRLEQVIPLLPAHLDKVRGQAIKVIAQYLNIPIVADDTEIEEIGTKAEEYTGADVEKLLIEADREATERGDNKVNKEDLERALGYIVPTAKTSKEMSEEAVKYCTNRRYLPETREAVKSAAGRRVINIDSEA